MCGSQACHIAFVHDCTVENVFPRGEIKIGGRVALQAEGLERGELVDGGEHRLLGEGRDGNKSIGGSGDRRHGGLRRGRCGDRAGEGGGQ